MEPQKSPSPAPDSPHHEGPVDPQGTTVPPPASTQTMCFSCGQMMTPDRVKCPACGAPMRSATPKRPGGGLKFAAFILAMFCFLSLITAVSILQNQEASIRQNVAFSEARHAFTGYATAGGENVSVTPDGDRNATVEAEPSGGFTIPGLNSGYHTLLFEAANHTSILLHVVLFADASHTLDLTPGAGTQEHEHSTYQQFRTIVRSGGAFMSAIGLLLAWAVYACYRRKTYGVALSGAIASILPAIPGLVMLPLAIIAIVLVVRGRNEFASRKKSQPQQS